jgi:hypothetical protein
MENYYSKELERLSGDVKVKFYSDSGDTKTLNINDESIDSIIDYLVLLKNRSTPMSFSFLNDLLHDSNYEFVYYFRFCDLQVEEANEKSINIRCRNIASLTYTRCEKVAQYIREQTGFKNDIYIGTNKF